MTIWDGLSGQCGGEPNKAPHTAHNILTPVFEAERIARIGVGLVVNDGFYVTIVAEVQDER